MLGLRTVVYKVPNLKEGKEWYAKAFETEPYFDEPFYVGFNIGGYELGLLPYDGEEVIHGDASTVYWGVEDINTVLARFGDLGATLGEEPSDVGDGVTVASVRDPWNNLIGLIYNPYFKIS